MYLEPMPGADQDRLAKALEYCHTEVENIRGRSHEAYKMREDYLRWAADAARQLRGVIRPEHIDTLVLTSRYWALLTMSQPGYVPMLELEIDERRDAFREARRLVEEEAQRNLTRPGVPIVVDTNVFIEHPDKFENLDLAELLSLGSVPIRLIVPIIVVDELDGLKTHRAQTHVPWRASYTLGVLSECLDPTGYGTIRGAGTAPNGSGLARGSFSAEILFDPPGHVRSRVADDEIIDRVRVTQSLLGREVTLVTYDTKMALRARFMGLRVLKLSKEIGDEVKPGEKAPKPSRQQRRAAKATGETDPPPPAA